MSLQPGECVVSGKATVTYEAGETVSPGDVVGVDAGALRAVNSGDTSPNLVGVVGHGGGADAGEDYQSGEQINREKYGEIIEVPEEDIMDNVFDLVADHVDLAAQEMAEFLDGLAFGELSNNLASASPVTDNANDDLTYDDVQEGVARLEENDATPDMAFVGPRGKQDILTYLAERGTDLTDEAIQTGNFGTIAGLDFMFSTVGDLELHNAILVDSDRYGYEATFTPIETEEEQDFATDTQKFKIRTRKGFKTIKPEAAIEVEG